MTNYSAFLFIDVDTPRTHIAAWRNRDEGWTIPCGLIPLPPSDTVTYAPTKPLCLLCAKKTHEPTTRVAPRT